MKGSRVVFGLTMTEMNGGRFSVLKMNFFSNIGRMSITISTIFIFLSHK